MRRLILAIAAGFALAAPARAAFTPPPVPQGAYTPYTPTVSCGSGTLTTVSAAAAYQTTGKRVDWQAAITITTNGTCTGNLFVTLPAGLPVTNARTYVLSGREDAASGRMLQGTFAAGLNTAKILAYDNSYPGANGAVLYVSGSYETQ